MRTKLLFLLLSISFYSKAQFVDFGQDPARFTWRQIKTENFQIIYPDFFEENAQKMANIYHILYNSANSLEHKPGKMSMVVHPGGGISNGSVGWAPKKSDLYTMPSQDPTDSWLEHLCIHEFRHIVQLDKINQGFTKGLYYIFGEQLPIAISGVFLPMWFLEGDAVTYESAIGYLGRGRSPEFINEMKAQILEKGIYSYDKAILGSSKDYIPNRYNLGYLMVGNARKNYGGDIWADAVQQVGRKPYTFVPFRRSLKKTLVQKRDSLWQDTVFTSLFVNTDSIKAANWRKDAKVTLYKDNFSELREIWKKEVESVNIVYDTIPTTNKYYTNYYYPTSLEDGSIIAYKKGFKETGAFVKIKGKEEKIITRTGIPDDYKFSYNNSQIVWTEYKSHPRWEHGGKQVLSSYDIISKKYTYHKAPYNRFSPFAIHENWGVVEVDEQNNSFILILDKNLNTEITRIAANHGELFIHPSFDGTEIITVVQSNQGNRIESIHPISLERKELTPWFRYEIDNPQRWDNTLLFRASFNGNNSFYSMDLNNGEITNILNSPFGIRFPYVNAKKDSLYFSFYTAEGYKPAEISWDKLEKLPAQMKSFALADTLIKYESGQRSFHTDSIFTTKKYRKFPHLFNIHSWGPMYVDPDEMSATVGVVAYSQNKLSTLILSGGYVYDSDYDKGAWRVNAQYKALWPTFNLKFESGKMNSYTLGSYTQNENSTNLFVEYDYRFSETELTMQLPFNISRKNYNRAIIPYSRYTLGSFHNYDIKHLYEQDEEVYREVPRNKYPLNFSSRRYQVMEYGLMFYNQIRRTTQEINPRWGQRIQGGYSHTPFKNVDLGAQWWIYGNFYFPGFFTNHSFNVYTGYQDRPYNFSYGKKVASGRGISVWGYDFGTLRTSYALPIAYPDWRIGGLAYLQTINASVFWDGSRQYIPYRMMNNIEYLWKNYCSYGMEITTDCYVVRLPFPVYAGIRLGYETQHKKMFAEFLFSVTFSL